MSVQHPNVVQPDCHQHIEQVSFLPLAELEIHLQSLNDALNARDFELLHNVLLKLVEGYNKPSLEPHST